MCSYHRRGASHEKQDDIDPLSNVWRDEIGNVYSLIASTVTVYAGGSFTTIGGASQPNLAPLDAITGLLE